jgi:hypothetical protein
LAAQCEAIPTSAVAMCAEIDAVLMMTPPRSDRYGQANFVT